MIRFLADVSLHHAIVSGCRRREPAVDFLSAHEAKLEGVPDSDVLAFAASTIEFWSLPISGRCHNTSGTSS